MYSIYLNTGEVKRDADGVVVSPCQTDTEQNYVDYIAWVNEGNEPTVADVQNPLRVLSVTPRQMRLALNALGLRSTVEAAIAGADQNTKDTWEFSLEVERDNPLVTAMGYALGKTDAELDDLFALAASL